MKPKYRLIEASISGVKCIDKPLTIAFTKKGFDSSVFDESLIKSIYGPNGSGKTAVITAFDIYRTILTNDFPFKQGDYDKLLEKIVNKKTHECSISIVFAAMLGGAIFRVRHDLILSKDISGEWRICFEALHQLNARLGVSKTIFQIDKGVLTVNNVKGVLKSVDPMVARNNSLVRLFANVILASNAAHTAFNDCISLTLGFAKTLFVVYGERQDAHIGHFMDWMLDGKEEDSSEALSDSYTTSKVKEVFKTVPGLRCFDVISPSSLDQYKNEIKKLCRFVKLLKQDLMDIEVVEKPFDQMLFINLWFVYDGYKVDFEFESAGVKKLCLLFSAFVAAKQGGIALIDEIDSNIHDTFLVKLFDYFSSYSDCQIICTTHNVEIMSVISPKSKSIDFLSNDHGVVPWIKTGRLSPSVLYLKGRIEFIPFNLDSSEFAEVFADDQAR